MAERQSLQTDFHPIVAGEPVEWVIDDGLVPYEVALREMEERVAAIAKGEAPERVWLLQHPPLYTAGTSADPSDLIAKDRFPVYETGRGGQYTYHGPGQRVAYVMLDLKRRKEDIRAFIAALEAWIISTLDEHNITGERREDRVGVWVRRPEKSAGVEDKIAAIGIRLRKWVSFHGISINVEPELEHFSGIVPCGISQHGVTSFVDLGHLVSMAEVDSVMKQQFEEIFGPVRVIGPSGLAEPEFS
ncbi:lipoyl(octanoyl) transferase LipB [Rhodobacteraceae bacterium RKSG542]|uniref:lipoyl(octanoyl) transferase LipB n=1 Tax=Pseudovibrio flavus TaxID=2529854 RepID=UPI0012BC7B4B|nr:lipoyl(octanoyl) transferase LipB [Pseudovibrio flavus]MTI16410.1 lipoyl(octanoyl) transferase LipB [Pseudovibrio flavus]